MSDSDSVIRETIDESPLFKHLSDEWRQRLAESSEVRAYEDETLIIEEGQEEQHNLFIVLEGQVRVWTESPDEEVDLKTLRSGAYFGEVSLLNDKIATANVEAQGTDLEVLAIDREPVLELIQNNQKVRDMLEGITVARAKDTIGKVLD
jgi:CRP-like cAMP-binding protein